MCRSELFTRTFNLPHDEAQMRSAVDGLDEMEAMLQEGDGEKLVAR